MIQGVCFYVFGVTSHLEFHIIFPYININIKGLAISETACRNDLRFFPFLGYGNLLMYRPRFLLAIFNISIGIRQGGFSLTEEDALTVSIYSSSSYLRASPRGM